MDSSGLVLATAGYTLVYFLTASTIAFTCPSSSIRAAVVAAILSLVLYVHNSVMQTTDKRNIGAGILMFVWLQVFNSLDLLLLSKVSYEKHIQWQEEQNTQKAPDRSQEPFHKKSRLTWAMKLALNYRRINTAHQITYIPRPSSLQSGPLPRTAFLIQRFLASALALGALRFFFSTEQASSSEYRGQALVLDEYSLSVGPLLSRTHVVASHILGTFLDHKAVYALLSCCGVGLGFDDPEDWPPNQGPVAGGWSVRRFWGQTWHQTFRVPLSRTADFIVDSVFRLKARTVRARYARFFITFFLSGLLHVPYDRSSGVGSDKSNVLLFFMLQPVAFAIEEIAQAVSERYNILNAEKDQALRRAIGYIWVVVWNFWGVSLAVAFGWAAKSDDDLGLSWLGVLHFTPK
ncbi:membrane bound O-acyl transferase family-domain-containing protein [Aspergillus unguis]